MEDMNGHTCDDCGTKNIPLDIDLCEECSPSICEECLEVPDFLCDSLCIDCYESYPDTDRLFQFLLKNLPSDAELIALPLHN